MVGQRYAVNRGGVAIAGPLHVSSSVPSELAVLAPGSVEQPLHYLRSLILARHTHAMLKRGVALVTVYLEPGMRAAGLNLWLLEVLAACILCFDGPGSRWGTGTRKTCPRPAGSIRSTARFLHLRHQHVQEEKARFSTTSWCPRLWLMARKRPKPFPTEVPVGPQRQEKHVDWTWAAEERPADLELAWLE